MKPKMLGYVLLLLAILILIGFIAQSTYFWLAIDVLMLLVCMIGGFFLIKEY